MSLNAATFGEFLFGDLLPLNIYSVTEDKYLQQIQRFVQEENAFMAQLMSVLADSGTEAQSGFLNGVGGRMHVMGKRGGVEATRGGQKWYVGYPIFAKGSKQTYEIPWLKRATFVELAASILTATTMDIETVIVDLLNALMSNVNYTFDDTQWPGMKALTPGSAAPITVYRLANADSSAGSVYAHGSEILLASLNHYLVSGNANPTIGAFNTMRSALRNVGNDVNIKWMCSRTTCDYIEANFGSDFIQPVELLDVQIAQDFTGKYALKGSEPLLGPGIRTRGRVARGELQEWPHFPDGYAFGWDATKEPPLRVRESDLGDERGFGLAPEDPNVPDVQAHPLARKQWRRIMGIGARNRCNGVVMQFTTNGSYTIPTL